MTWYEGLELSDTLGITALIKAVPNDAHFTVAFLACPNWCVLIGGLDLVRCLGTGKQPNVFVSRSTDELQSTGPPECGPLRPDGRSISLGMGGGTHGLHRKVVGR